MMQTPEGWGLTVCPSGLSQGAGFQTLAAAEVNNGTPAASFREFVPSSFPPDPARRNGGMGGLVAPESWQIAPVGGRAKAIRGAPS